MDAPPLAPGLYVVATPIGNLRDITLRALDVLKTADALFAEDTRVTRKLLSAYGIPARAQSYHDHNTDSAGEAVLALLRAGKRVALVSDAGTPLISDPGYRLVAAARAEGLPVYPIPGASALTAALSACGLPTDAVHFVGFLPAKSGAREKAIAALAAIPATLVLYESARRLPDMLQALWEGLGGDRLAVIARELTKLHEEFRSGTLAELAAHYAAAGAPKGEVVILIAPPADDGGIDPAPQAEELLRRLLPVTRLKEAVAEVAAISGLPRKTVYAMALEMRDALPGAD